MNWPERVLLSGQITHNMAYEHLSMLISHVVTSCISCCDVQAFRKTPVFYHQPIHIR